MSALSNTWGCVTLCQGRGSERIPGRTYPMPGAPFPAVVTTFDAPRHYQWWGAGCWRSEVFLVEKHCSRL